MTESLYATLASRVDADRLGPPGTEETRVVETVDNDVMGVLPLVDARRGDPRPTPGTMLTFTIETVDNDVMGILSCIPMDNSPSPRTRATAPVETVDEDVSHVFVPPG